MYYKGIKLPTTRELAAELGVWDTSISKNAAARESSANKYMLMKLGLLKKRLMPQRVVEELSKSLDDGSIYIKTIRHKHKVLLFLGLLHKAEIDAIKGD